MPFCDLVKVLENILYKAVRQDNRQIFKIKKSSKIFCYAKTVTPDNTLYNRKQGKDLHLNFKNIIYTNKGYLSLTAVHLKKI